SCASCEISAEVPRCVCIVTTQPDGTALFADRLAVPVVERLDAAEEADAAKADLVRARVVADVVRLARSVDETREPGRAGLDEVRDTRSRRPRDHVTDADRVRLTLRTAHRRARGRPELERPAAVEHDERLLLRGVAVRDRELGVRPAARPLEPG